MQFVVTPQYLKHAQEYLNQQYPGKWVFNIFAQGIGCSTAFEPAENDLQIPCFKAEFPNLDDEQRKQVCFFCLLCSRREFDFVFQKYLEACTWVHSKAFPFRGFLVEAAFDYDTFCVQVSPVLEARLPSDPSFQNKWNELVLARAIQVTLPSSPRRLLALGGPTCVNYDSK